MSTWTALASAERARRQIESQLDAVAATVRSVTFPRNQATLNLMKGLSGAELLLCDAQRKPLLDDQDRPITTLPAVPDKLPEPVAADEHPLGMPVDVAGKVYFCRGVGLRQDASAQLLLYVFYPESLWRDALWQAVRPALFLGGIGGVVAIGLTVAVAGRFTRRIQQLERRTRLIAAGDFSPMQLQRRDDELRDLGLSVNEMAQRLADYRETVAMTERLRLLGQVSGGLAHQLRNGVAGARLAVQLHARECGHGENGEVLEVALRQLTLTEMHLKRFLDLGKTIELNREPCDLRSVVDEALTLLGPQCRHAQIKLRTTKCEDPLTILADASQLGNLMLNVLANAIEAAGPGGSVEVRTGTTAASWAWVEVIDSGPGISAEVAARLFEPFVTGKKEGVGLGLAVARQVAQAHGGSITWSRRTEGTCFRIDIPLESAKPQAKKE